MPPNITTIARMPSSVDSEIRGPFNQNAELLSSLLRREEATRVSANEWTIGGGSGGGGAGEAVFFPRYLPGAVAYVTNSNLFLAGQTIAYDSARQIGLTISDQTDTATFNAIEVQSSSGGVISFYVSSAGDVFGVDATFYTLGVGAGSPFFSVDLAGNTVVGGSLVVSGTPFQIAATTGHLTTNGKIDATNATSSSTTEPWLDIESQANSTGLVARFKRTSESNFDILFLNTTDTFLRASSRLIFCYGGSTSNRAVSIDSSGPRVVLCESSGTLEVTNAPVGVSIGRDRGLFGITWSTTTEGVPRWEIVGRTIDNTHASRKYGVDFNPYDTATRQGLRIDADGTNAIAAFGSTVTTDTRLTVHGTALGSKVLRLTTAATNDDPNRDLRQNRVATTNATVTTIDTIAITASKTYGLKVIVVARRTGGTAGTADDGAYYERQAMVTTKAGTVTINTTGAAPVTIEDQAGWDVTLAVSGTDVLVQVTGAADNSIVWHSHVWLSEVGT